jgi:alanine-alpha-ketoisovalerate/valine-pyruvate aminotransferase
LVSSELKLISELVKNETDPVTGYEKIINVITGEELGRLKATVRARGVPTFAKAHFGHPSPSVKYHRLISPA